MDKVQTNFLNKNKEFFQHTLFAGMFRALAAGSTFIFSLVVAKLLGDTQAGIFFFGHSMALMLGLLCLSGMDNAVLRYIPKHLTLPKKYRDKKRNYRPNQIITAAYVTVISVSVIVSLICFFLSPFISLHSFGSLEYTPVLKAFSASIPFISIFFLHGYIQQAKHRPILAILSMQLGVTCISLYFFYHIYSSNPRFLTPFMFSSLYFGAAGITAAICIQSSFLRSGGYKLNFNNFFELELWKSLPSYWLISSVGQALPWAIIFITGFMINENQLALFSTAFRTALLISFLLTVVNMVVAPKFAAYHQAHRIDLLKNLSQLSARVMITLSIPIILFVFYFPEKIMGLFGDNFVAAAPILMILAAGQCINVMTGSVGFLLTMCGYEKEMRNIVLTSSLLTIILLILFTPLWGVFGSAAAVCIGVVFQNITALFQVKLRLGFWPC